MTSFVNQRSKALKGKSRRRPNLDSEKKSETGAISQYTFDLAAAGNYTSLVFIDNIINGIDSNSKEKAQIKEEAAINLRKLVKTLQEDIDKNGANTSPDILYSRAYIYSNNLDPDCIPSPTTKTEELSLYEMAAAAGSQAACFHLARKYSNYENEYANKENVNLAKALYFYDKFYSDNNWLKSDLVNNILKTLDAAQLKGPEEYNATAIRMVVDFNLPTNIAKLDKHNHFLRQFNNAVMGDALLSAKETVQPEPTTSKNEEKAATEHNTGITIAPKENDQAALALGALNNLFDTGAIGGVVAGYVDATDGTTEANAVENKTDVAKMAWAKALAMQDPKKGESLLDKLSKQRAGQVSTRS